MNILFLGLDIDLERPRGDSIHFSELAHHLANRGHVLRIVTATAKSVPGVSAHYVRAGATAHQIWQASRLANGWADVIYERRTSPKIAWATSLLTGIPFTVEVDAVVEEERVQLSSTIRNDRWRRLLRQLMFRSAARVIAVSDGIASHLRAQYRLDGARVVVIPNGANTDLFRPMDKNVCRQELGLPSDAPVVCFVGNLVPWQGVESLLKTTNALRRTLPDLRTLIVGGGPQEQQLRAIVTELRLEKSVTFFGWMPYLEVPRIINASDVCVALLEPSRKASPLKLFEYLACRKPVVATDIDGVGDLLRMCRGGLIVEPGNVEDVAASITRLIQKPNEAALMAESGYRFVTRERSWATIASRVATVLEEGSRSRKRRTVQTTKSPG